MKLLNAKINWNEHFMNAPDLQVLVDEIPSLEDMVFTERNGLYLAIRNGFAMFFAYDGPSDGYGGRSFRLKMADGSIRTLVGPWSSRSSCVNAAFPETPVMEVSLCANPAAFDLGYTFMAAACTLDFARKAVKKAHAHLVEYGYVQGEKIWTPSKHPDLFVKPYAAWNCKKISGYEVHPNNDSVTVHKVKRLADVATVA